MKYRIIEEIDGVGDSVFFAEYETSTFFGKTKWNKVYDHMVFANKRFKTSAAAYQHLKKCYSPKTIIVVSEGEI